MILVIDNYDSFTYNIVHYLIELGAEVEVVRNDQYQVDELVRMKPDRLLISPGPCTPDQSGVSIDAIDRFAGVIPILGVCLGHQAIGQYFGASVIRAQQVMHGKLSEIEHSSVGVFSGLKNPLTVTRYHSLLIDKERLPDSLEVTAWTTKQQGVVEEIMGIRHRTLPIEGVQFHPESILTDQGHELFANFLRIEAQ